MHDYEFDVEFDVDESIGQYQSLNLMLQPLIENAIAHGIDVKTDGRGKLTITGKEDGDLIVLTVADNGVGMSDEQAARILTEESKGYGVRNVNERIKLYYGEGITDGSYDNGSVTQLYNWYESTDPARIKVVKGRYDYASGADGLISLPNENPYWEHYRHSTAFQHSQNRYDNKFTGEEKIYLYAGLNSEYASPHAQSYDRS